MGESRRPTRGNVASGISLRPAHKAQRLARQTETIASTQAETITMSVEIDLDHSPPFPKRIPEKLKTIREHLGLTPDEIAPKVGAKNGREISMYENDEVDLLVPVMWGYAKLAGCPIDNLVY